jgi:hypothetical protein
MGRLIEVRPQPAKKDLPEAASLTEGDKKDDALTRVAKLVPTEIVAGYIPLVAAAEAIAGDSGRKFSFSLGAFFLGLVLTPIYLWFTGKPKNWVQKLSVLISTIAFVLWAYLLGGPFTMEGMTAYLGHYDKQIGSFIVFAFTWIAGLFPFDKFLKEDAGGAGS